MAARRKTTRRDFLVGRSARQAISDLPELDEARLQEARTDAATDSTEDSTDTEAKSYLLQVGRDAMACEFQVLLNAGQHLGGTEVALEALDLVELLEDQLTVYRQHSEISRINRTAGQQPVMVEPRLFELLERAVQLCESTSGAFDITAGPLWKTWGFHRRAGRFPSSQEINAALAQVGSRWLKLDSHKRTVAFLRPELEINLGGIGKGYALDRCGEFLGERGIHDFVMHGGYSSMLARGDRLGNEPGRGWKIVLRHPLRQERRLAEIRLRDRALGTSGSGNQFFHFAGKRYGHVIDPRSGFPADRLLSATVLAPSATEADALATAFFVMGVEPTKAFCESRPDLSAILVSAGERAGATTIHAFGMQDEDWDRLE